MFILFIIDSSAISYYIIIFLFHMKCRMCKYKICLDYQPQSCSYVKQDGNQLIPATDND